MPTTSEARPGRCPACDAAGHVVGAPVTLVGHGVRDRQVRGPTEAGAAPRVITILTRRFRCRPCRAVFSVVPRGLTARRHFSASAIGLGLLLYGVERRRAAEVAKEVGLWGPPPSAWRTLARWSQAVEVGTLLVRARVRAGPSEWPRRERASRAAMTLAALAPSSSGPIASRVMAGAALAA